jgi:hypothetical protein
MKTKRYTLLECEETTGVFGKRVWKDENNNTLIEEYNEENGNWDIVKNEG